MTPEYNILLLIFKWKNPGIGEGQISILYIIQAITLVSGRDIIYNMNYNF